MQWIIVNDRNFQNKTFIYCLDFDGNIIHKVGPSRANQYQPYMEKMNKEKEENSMITFVELNLAQSIDFDQKKDCQGLCKEDEWNLATPSWRIILVEN